MIYVIKAVNTRHVKIGVAKNPFGRMRYMQTGIPMELVLLAAVDWPDSQERRLHRVLRAHRLRGEWFTLDEDMLDSLIKHMQSGAKNADEWIEAIPHPSRLSSALRIAR